MKKVLVVEDNEINRFLMRAIFEKLSYDVIEAHDGLQAIKFAETEEPDLIIMDIQLPEMDGCEATKKIRTMEKMKEVPIIAVTSYAMVGDKKRILAAGCTAYIEKPIDPKSFIKELKKYI